MMRRRAFLSGLGGCPAAASLAEAQQGPGKVHRIGVLAPGADFFPWLGQALTEGVKERGYVEGQNSEIDRRYADNDAARLPALAAELVKARVDVIVTTNVPSTQAAAAETRTIPIVFVALAL